MLKLCIRYEPSWVFMALSVALSERANRTLCARLEWALIGHSPGWLHPWIAETVVSHPVVRDHSAFDRFDVHHCLGQPGHHV